MTNQESSKGTTQGLEDMGYIEESTLMLRYKQNGVWFEARGTENILSKFNDLWINPIQIELTKARIDEATKARGVAFNHNTDTGHIVALVLTDRIATLNTQLESHKQKRENNG